MHMYIDIHPDHNGTSNGFWYHASHAHTMVSWGNSTTGPHQMQWTPRGDCKPAGNCTTSLYGVRGPAWVDSTTFTDDIHWVDLNSTQAVQLSEAAGVKGYHRRIIANWQEGPLYILWDAIDTDDKEICARAVSNIHVVTELGWDGKIGCAATTEDQVGEVGAGQKEASAGVSSVLCHGLNSTDLRVDVLRPPHAAAQKLLTIKADPLPAQFTGMLGAKRGGAFAGDWNANGNVAPPKPHWPARSSTWLQLGMPNATADSARPICTGFITMMQVREPGAASDLKVLRFEEQLGGSALLEVEGKGRSLYLLGDQRAGDSLEGLAAVATWSKAGQLRSVLLQEGTWLGLEQTTSRGLTIAASAPATLSVKLTAPDQYRVLHHGNGVGSVTVEVSLPWSADAAKEVNVWDSAHAYHLANSSATTAVRFEALPETEYIVEALCPWTDAGGGGFWCRRDS